MDIEKYLKSGIVEQYVLGLCSPDERAEVEHMANKYPEVNSYIVEIQGGMEQYAEMQSVNPPPGLKRKIMKEVEQMERNKRDHQPIQVNYRMNNFWRWGTGIAAMMILGLGVLSYMLFQNQKDARDELALMSTQIKHLQEDYKNLEVSKESIEQRYVVLKDVGTKHVHLRGSDNAPQALAVVYWNPDHSKGYLNIINMPKPPHGHQYQVWADVAGVHKNMGTLRADEDGNVLHHLPYIDNSRGFVITLEEEGGSDHPTVEKMYVHGEI